MPADYRRIRSIAQTASFCGVAWFFFALFHAK